MKQVLEGYFSIEDISKTYNESEYLVRNKLKKECIEVDKLIRNKRFYLKEKIKKIYENKEAEEMNFNADLFIKIKEGKKNIKGDKRNRDYFLERLDFNEITLESLLKDNDRESYKKIFEYRRSKK